MLGRTRTVLVLVASGLVLAFACGVAWWFLTHGPRTLTKAEAERLLRSSDYLKETAKTRLVLSRNLFFPATDLLAEHPEVVKFIDLGLVEVRPNEVLWGRPVGAKFVLTAAGERSATDEWQHTSGPGGEEAWFVPTARKELVQVRKPTTRDESASCMFVWKWVPTKIGEKTGASKTTETSSARFYLDDERWYLDESSLVSLARK